MNEIQLQDIKKLLKDVGKNIEKSKEIARLKGENFNIFSILGIETKENKTHSSFIASLLNPKGKHGLGDTFLKLFYETILTKGIGIDLTDDKKQIVEYLKHDIVEVKTEVSIGKINYDDVEGGRVDISLQGNNRNIFIENKIYAGDQHLQIARYIKNKETLVFYLTLFGDEPSKGSSGKYKVNEDFFLLSYNEDIKNWLEKCQKEASDYPIIRETIKQYLILIKKLTGQLTTQKEMEEIKELIKKNFENANIIVNNFEEVKIEIVDKFIKEIKRKLENNLGKDWEVKLEDIRKSWSSLRVKHKDWEGRISMQGSPLMWKNKTILGLSHSKNNLKMLKEVLNIDIYEEIISEYNMKSDCWTFYKKNFDLRNNLQFTKLLNQKSFDSFVNETVITIIKLAKNLEQPLKKITK